MRMNRKLKWMIITIVFTSFILTGSMQVFSEEEYLIVRIVNANFPPRVLINNVNHFSLFEFETQIQIENPTQSNIKVDYICSPSPFPCLQTNLENKSLSVSLAVYIEGVGGSYNIPPGITSAFAFFAFFIEPYENEYLPLGNYIFWFDYVECCSVSVPVFTEKLNIHVSQSNVTYFFEYNNSTEVYYLHTPTPTPTPTTTPLQQTNQTSFPVIFIFVFFLFRAIIRRLFTRRKVVY